MPLLWLGLWLEDVTAHIESAIAHAVTATARMASGTIKPIFEPTATAPEQTAKPFLFERGFTPSDPHSCVFDATYTTTSWLHESSVYAIHKQSIEQPITGIIS